MHQAITYQNAGVNIDAGNLLVEKIKPHARSTMRAEVLGGLGGFGALFALDQSRYREPILVSTTDGVGTKLRLAIELQQHDTIGIDLVAMCVNDLIVQGAEPLFFLDYYATGKLDVLIAEQVIAGIAVGCKEAGTALVGGETAEMPGMYQSADYDLAGFAVGIVERDQLIDGRNVQIGDAILGIAASGLHSNGYSLVRHLLKTHNINLQDNFDGRTIGETLLIPTKIYVKSILSMIKKCEIHAIAHITGGGLIENPPRVLPNGTQAVIDTNSWPRPPIFSWLQELGLIATQEMYRTFNCGIGMMVCLPPEQIDCAICHLAECGETAWKIGEVTFNPEKNPHVVLL